MARPQKGKHRKRPRSWHRNQHAGIEQLRALDRLDDAVEAHLAAQAVLAGDRERGSDQTAVWRALAHVNPPAGLELWPEWL